MKQIPGIVAAATYIASSILYVHYLVNCKETAEKIGRVILWIAFCAHTIMLVIEYADLGSFPVIDLSQSLGFMAWSLAIMYLLVRMRRPAGALGSFVVPVLAAFFIISVLVESAPHPPDDRFSTILFPLHILMTFAGYAAFTLAFAAAIMYLLQERGLKSRRPGKLLERLPSISVLDDMIYHSLALGFPLITLGIIIGAIWLNRVVGVFLGWDPKIVSSVVTWLLYAAILHARLLSGWRGRKFAALSILGYVMVLFTFLGAGFFAKGFHSFFVFP